MMLLHYDFSPAEAHIWQVMLDQPKERTDALLQVLSEDERARVYRFYHKENQRRFIACRGTLRAILSEYLNCRPGALRFQYRSNGKPFLLDEPGHSPIQFNVAHSSEVAVIGVTQGHEIGVDVEYVHDFPQMESIAVKFFSPREVADLSSLPDAERQTAFFKCWTCKEAYIKALGKGFSQPLDQFAVSVKPELAAHIVEVRHDWREAEQWSLESFVPAPGYIASVAVQSRGLRVCHLTAEDHGTFLRTPPWVSLPPTEPAKPCGRL